MQSDIDARRWCERVAKQHFLFLGHQDLSGLVRGRSVPRERRKEALSGGLPWVPANYSIGPTNALPPDNPFGPMGEIRLFPDEAAMAYLPAFGNKPAFDLTLCDARMPDGSPWPFCPRTALKNAAARLKSEAGLTMKVAFETEFLIKGLDQPSHPAFSLVSGRAVSHVADLVMEVLARSGIQLEQFQAEYGFDQFEISAVPADPLAAADCAVLTNEVIRDCARQLGLHATFLPKPSMNGIGNGVHIHFSLYGGNKPVTAEKDWVTDIAGSFVQGILDAAESVVPFSCLSANSYLRLRPHSWVGSYTCAGVKNREAMIRLVPRKPDSKGRNPQASLEYRAADATANVYLALAAIIGAGLDGLKVGRMPTNITQDPENLSADERARLGLRHLPQSIHGALQSINSDAAGRWLGPELVTAYLACRREDARQFASGDDNEAAKVLQTIY
jgi:glutamine synthetase